MKSKGTSIRRSPNCSIARSETRSPNCTRPNSESGNCSAECGRRMNRFRQRVPCVPDTNETVFAGKASAFRLGCHERRCFLQCRNSQQLTPDGRVMEPVPLRQLAAEVTEKWERGDERANRGNTNLIGGASFRCILLRRSP